MHAKELQRYKRLLVEKRQELRMLSPREDAVIPGAGGFAGDPVDQANANADAEAELQIQLHRSDGRLLRAIEEAVPWTSHCRDCKEREHSAP